MCGHQPLLDNSVQVTLGFFHTCYLLPVPNGPCWFARFIQGDTGNENEDSSREYQCETMRKGFCPMVQSVTSGIWQR